MRTDWKPLSAVIGDVAGDLFTVNERTEIEKRFQMFYFLKRNQCHLDPAFSIHPGGRIISE